MAQLLLSCAAFASVVPAPKRAPAHVGTLSNRIFAAGIWRYAGTFRSNQADRRNNQKIRADDPRGLSRARFLPVAHALAVASALGFSLFFTPHSCPVLLLRLPCGPLPRLLSTASTAVALRGLLRMEGLLTSFQQTHPRSRLAREKHASACLLILGSVCRTFRKAHGRYCSQKLMPRRGTANSSPGRSSSFTDRESEVHAAQTHSTSTHSLAGTRSLGSQLFPSTYRHILLVVRPTLDRQSGPLSIRH